MFSIIVPNYNGEKFLEKCLSSILSTIHSDFELIVIDNNSSDSSMKILDHFARDKRVKIVTLDDNIGYGPANNIGIKHSKGEFLVFINNDTSVDPFWLSEIYNSFSSDKSVAAVQCMLLNMISPGVYSLGGSLDYSGRLVPIECVWDTSPCLKEQNRLFWGSGAALSIRRSVLEKIGGFDPELPNDEVDICWRINLNGGKILLAPNAVVYHYGSGSFGTKLSVKRIYLSERSMLTSSFRNFDLKSFSMAFVYLLSFLPMAFALDILFRRRADIVLGRAKAYFEVLINLRKINSQRNYVQTNIRNVKDSELRKLMLKPNPWLLLRYSKAYAAHL